MQTFVPEVLSYKKSLQMLDPRRLNKQNLEATQIAQLLYHKRILTGSTTNFSSWSNHPAVLMWKNCKEGLLYYINFGIIEMQNRGYLKNSALVDDFYSFINSMNISLTNPVYPDWWGGDIHYSHAAALLFKSWIKAVVFKLSHDYKIPVNKVEQNHVSRNLSNFKRDQVLQELTKLRNTKYIVSDKKLKTELSIFDRYYSAYKNITPRLEYVWPN